MSGNCYIDYKIEFIICLLHYNVKYSIFCIFLKYIISAVVL